tara:strand:- start:2121 stop:2900 length:780 start_codon:yes stop_codon:yes gene_type:complete
MDASDSNHKSLESIFEDAEPFQERGGESLETSLSLASDIDSKASEISEAENQFMESLISFQSEQEKILLKAQSMLPVQCSKCNIYIQSKKDVGCASKHGCCFTCYTVDMSQKTLDAESQIEDTKFELIATMDLSDYEEWLFDDEMGRRTLARVIAKLKSQGYDYKPWQISIGAAAWSKENYRNTSLEDTRYLVERAKPNDLNSYIPESADGISTVIDSIKRAEEIRGINTTSKSSKKHWPVIGGIAGISIIIPYLMKRK